MGRGILMDSYKKIKLSDGTTIDEHRLVTRVVGFDTVVHHIDGNKKNNSLENLQIMSRSEHCKLHGFGTKIRPSESFAPDKYGKAICKKCGSCKPITQFKKDISYKCGYASICKSCFNEYKRNLRKQANSCQS